MISELKALCLLDGVSGDEKVIRAYILKQLADIPYADTTVDALGNVLVHLKGKKQTAQTVMLAAHMDEVGLIVTGITEDGYLRVATVGGIDKAVLFGHRVRFGKHCGVIGGKAIHMCKGDEKTKLPSGDLLVDIGAPNKETAYNMVSLGDYGVFDSEFYTVGNLVKGRAIDDRVGCAVLLAIARQEPPIDLWLAFTVQEEVGLRGAKTVAFAIDPDIAIVVDATTAADTAGVSEDKQVCCVGKGAVVSFMDRRTLYDKELYQLIMRVADEAAIPAQPKSMIAGGNDAGSIQTAASGAKVAAVSLPCRYIHSPSCMVSPEDVDAVYRLLSALIERFAN